ncbi:ATP-binding cassette domain-containing protein [Streptomyces calvus]|uniref:ATP-binding cassette domain-containing protein n=2 Tax=Streptomyces TaxID=1883 RepID=UPI0036255D9C
MVRGQRVGADRYPRVGPDPVAADRSGAAPAWRGPDSGGWPGHGERHGGAWRRRAGAWIPQKPATDRLPLLAGELPAGGGARAEAAEAAGKLGVGHLADRPLHTLSGGRLQRMYLARAGGCAAAGAGVLLADEPTAALDFSGQEEAAGVLLSLPVAVVVVAEELVPRSLCARMAGARALRCCWRCARGPVRPRGSGYQRRAACGRAR